MTGEAVVIEVRDNGPGFDPDLAERAASPFTTTKPDGLGLGLSLARSIIEAHGGPLSIESGSVRRRRVLHAAARCRSTRKRMTIALIEDDEAVLDSLRLLLQSRGLAVERLQVGRGISCKLGQMQSACIVSDVRLPGQVRASICSAC